MEFVSLLLLLVSSDIIQGKVMSSQSRREREPRSALPVYPDWEQRGKNELEEALSNWPKWKPAKNVVLFIGDGMGVSTVTAARFFKAQRVTQGVDIFDTELSWESFPSSGLIKTYSMDQQTTDSSSSATAFMCGEKTRTGMICINQKAARFDCEASLNNTLKSIVHHAIDEDKWIGIISTASLADATPAVAYSNAPDRDWKSDVDIPPEHKGKCPDIASQLIDREENKHIKVILGGGRREFYPTTVADPEGVEPNRRTDGRNLAQEWVAQKVAMGAQEANVHYVEKKSDFDAADPTSTEYLFGLFESDSMKWEADRRVETGDWTEPSLAEMVDKAIRILQRGPNGYFLYVEGGLIDKAHHKNNAYRSLMDTVALDEAVQKAVTMTNVDDTLLVVTADHSHLFTIPGDTALDSDIMGISVLSNGSIQVNEDNKPHTNVAYINGPGYYSHRTLDGNVSTEIPRKDLTQVNTTGVNFVQDSSIPRTSATHGGEDVTIFARGPMSHLFTGLHEQSYVTYAIKYAACLGDNKEMCEDPRPPPPCEPLTNRGINVSVAKWLVFWSLLCISSIYINW